MEVTTPLFNGGADPEHTGEVRVPSLRGALRFWFRALVGLGVGPDLRALARTEAAVFGDTNAASAVAIRIPNPPAAQPEGRPEWIQLAGGRWVVYLLGQGLGDVRAFSGPRPATRRGPGRGPGLPAERVPVRRPFVPAGERFDLQLRLTGNEHAAALVVASLWLLCAYGGLGARSRRGFGGLRILDIDGHLPAHWDNAALRTPALDHYEQLTRLFPNEAVGRSLAGLGSIPTLGGLALDTQSAWSDRLPTYPVLHRTHTKAGTSGGETFRSWAEVLSYAGEQLRHFRASEPYPAANYHPKIKTPEWAAVVTGAGSHFRLGALGLPVGYKAPYVVNADRGAGPRAEPLRRASPLWLRPVGSGQHWRLLSYAFRGAFLPTDDDPGLGVHVWRDGRQQKAVTVADTDVTQLTDRWIDTLARDGTFIP